MGGPLKDAWPVKPCLDPHHADTRLQHPTPASSGTLNDLPPHGRQLGTYRRESTQGLGGWPCQLLPCPEISPEDDLSFPPPKAGFHAAHWVVYIPSALAHAPRLSPLRDVERSGALCLPDALHFPQPKQAAAVIIF